MELAKDAGFKNGPLADMTAVGAVGPSRVQIWVRSRRPGRLEAVWKEDRPDSPEEKIFVDIAAGNQRDNTCIFLIPGEAGGRPLRPLCRYRFRIRHISDGHLLGAGRFETAPAAEGETPERFSVALMSCNQPFKGSGRLHEKSVQMLAAARKCLKEHNTRLVLMVGDQIYSEFQEPANLHTDHAFGA